MQVTLSKIGMIGLVTLLAVTGCQKKAEETDNTSAASTAEAQAVPMSAAPADDSKAPAIVNETNATVDLGAETAASAAASAGVASSAELEDGAEGEADNSAMDKITENDLVIDNEPASPNAPRAAESNGSKLGNAKIGQ